MSEAPRSDKNEENAPQPNVPERELPLDTRLLSEAVIELNISRKNVGIYPPGHVQITKSIARAYDILQKLFEIREEMTLGVAKNTLLVGQDYLDRKNPVYRDFALSLNQQEIASVTFISGLDKEELVRFHRILTTKPEDIRAEGGIDAVMAAANIPHIRIQSIDYSRFHVTEEEEILTSQGKGGAGGKGGGKVGGSSGGKAGPNLWQDFVTHLSEGTLAGPGVEGTALIDAEHVEPAELARLLNERRLDPDAALQSYDRIISEHVRVRAEKKQLTTEQSATLENLNQLLKDVHPELRKQFLSVAFRRLSSHAAISSEEILGGFSDDLVIDMLKQASAEGREISPTLTGLLGKLTKAQAQQVVSDRVHQAGGGSFGEGVDLPNILPEHMEKLFDREKYEEYVSDDYDAMLRRLSEGSGAAGEAFPLEEYTHTLDEDHVDFQIGRALLAFLEEDIDEDDYKEFATKLTTIVPEFLKSGNFVLLTDIVETLRRHEKEKISEIMRAAAAESLGLFKSPDFIPKAISSFDLWARSKGREAAKFILTLGPECVPGLLDIFAVDETPGGRRVLFDLLVQFGQFSVREALRRLRDPRAYYVRNLIMLLRWAGTPTVVPSIKLLLKHPDEKVRMEALIALLRFKDPEATLLLRQAIRSKDPDVSSQAVFLAGHYRISEVIDDVLAQMKRVILFEEDYTVNEEIIKSLAEIGDPRALPDLEKLARARTLYPKRRVKMQMLLYESLNRYPRESIGSLLRIGERSDDERIRRLCSRMMEKT